ncbi:hypothetical protein K503DRAFT_858548 [Rhizopogon vinicolor AM-OR11-026]|uniref:C2 NT-type domain-containing protein n=1 Tax=Rhizopogon vinicolor AM-OR11-026 TaxID=1314800 RepID=A0A1B7MSI1_9AGAM|nr:hypothetical protein K503DRAFT_858548 [Rhizopogon vinicolor AM-OR11-026]
MLFHDSWHVPDPAHPQGASSSTSLTSGRERSTSTLRPPKKPPPKLHLSPVTSQPDNRPSSPDGRAKSPTLPAHSSGHVRPPSPTPGAKGHATGFRAQLAHLLPRHAVFLLRLTVHQLSSVPLVHGEFGVRWKFKGVTSGGGLLGKVKGKGKAYPTAAPNRSADLAKGKEKEKLHESETDAANAIDLSDAHSITNSNSTHSHDPSIPSVVVSANTPVSANTTPRSVSTPSTSSSPSPYSHPHNPHILPQYLSADWLPQTPPPNPTPSLANSPPTAGYAPAKGQTPFEKLKDHSVSWEQTLDVVVQMGIGRETNELGDCEAKLVVMQRVIPGDPDAPRNPRLGAVSLNLAQYVGAGIVTRRYLLRQSKTNATLKLTVQLEHIGGDSSYVAPPLPKGEILSGIAGLLESDVYRTTPRILDLHANSSSSSLSTASTNSSPKRGRKKKKRKPLDIKQLPNTRGVRGTEKLIEALFNPTPVTRPALVTPFTYLVEPEVQEQPKDSLEGTAEDGYVYLEDEGRQDEPPYADSVDLNHISPSRQDSESDYQSIPSKWSGSLRASSIKSTRSASRLGVNEFGATTAVLTTTTVEKRTWWRKVLHPGAAS